MEYIIISFFSFFLIFFNFVVNISQVNLDFHSQNFLQFKVLAILTLFLKMGVSILQFVIFPEFQVYVCFKGHLILEWKDLSVALYLFILFFSPLPCVSQFKCMAVYGTSVFLSLNCTFKAWHSVIDYIFCLQNWSDYSKSEFWGQ